MMTNLNTLGQPQFFINPNKLLAELREQQPVYYHPQLDAWFLTRYHDVVSVLKDSRFSAARAGEISTCISPVSQERWQVCQQYLSGIMVVQDPPHHTTQRTLIAAPFLRNHLGHWQMRAQQVAEQLAQNAATTGRFELLAALADPLPRHIIAEMLALPYEEVVQLEANTGAIFAFFGARNATTDLVNQTYTALKTIRDTLASWLTQRPDDTLSPALPLKRMASLEERVYLAFALLVGSLETTTFLIAHALLALQAHPDAWSALVEDPSLATAAVEETLRYDGPAFSLVRSPREAVTIDEVTIPAGARVYCVLHAANHDPVVFASPERFDLHRDFRKVQVGFGVGPHVCLGAWLSRMEAAAALRALAQYVPSLSIVGAVERFGNFGMRGVRSVPIQVLSTL
ncbi:MAG: cytochrome P450 [Cyanobacteria bacterium P01_F01_bin.150]